MSTFTTDTLIASIKRRGMIPTNQSTFDTDDFLALANEEIQLGLLPLILSTREEYYVTSKDYSAADSIDIPERSVGAKVRDVKLVDSNEVEQDVPQVDFKDRDLAAFLGFYIQGNKIYFTDTPDETIRVYYYQRPNELVATSDAAQIASIDVNNNQVTVSSLPSTITTSTPVDIIKAAPGYDCLAIDQTITNIASTTLTFSSLPTGLAVGDWIALAGESPIVQLPKELQPILSQRVTVRILQSTGDLEQMGAAQADLNRMEAAAFRLIEPRTDGANHKIINRFSSLRLYPYARVTTQD